MKHYVAIFYNHIAQEEQLVRVSASDEAEALDAVELYMRTYWTRSANKGDIERIHEELEPVYSTIDDLKQDFRKIYNTEPPKESDDYSAWLEDEELKEIMDHRRK